MARWSAPLIRPPTPGPRRSMRPRRTLFDDTAHAAPLFDWTRAILSPGSATPPPTVARACIAARGGVAALFWVVGAGRGDVRHLEPGRRGRSHSWYPARGLYGGTYNLFQMARRLGRHRGQLSSTIRTITWQWPNTGRSSPRPSPTRRSTCGFRRAHHRNRGAADRRRNTIATPYLIQTVGPGRRHRRTRSLYLEGTVPPSRV